ncbi:hypothetical protein H0H81_003318 [Sphagnurus paluster]|uniref:KOW domain-containing protein n=1 Tax=Sphagnurus paluster TaxID=117069 RepID=A0A9P7FLV5_9AGAR|nr:hypothetical protein H0H81_003318 [Sphagnurus paluster]
MPLSLSSLFCLSQHPTIQEIIESGSRLPPPREWEFYEDKKVTITTGTHQGQEGVVQTVEADYILVDLSNGGGLFNFGWNNVQKCFKVKDFVQIINGPNQGHSGWVTEVLNRQMTCTELLERQPSHEQSDFPELAYFTAHVNCARMAEVPYLWTSSTSATVTNNSGPDPSQPKESTRDQDPKHQPDRWLRLMRVPWKGTPVLIVGNEQHKGKTGRVCDVHISRPTPSGLEVDVVVVGPQFVMHPLNKEFHPRNHFSKPNENKTLQSPDTVGSRTPTPASDKISSSMPSWDSLSSTPGWYFLTSMATWDPLLAMPVYNASLSSRWVASTLTSHDEISTGASFWDATGSSSVDSLPAPILPPCALAPPTHILLDPQLKNVKVQVKVTSVDYKDKQLVVWGMVLAGRRRIVHAVRGAVKDLTGAMEVLEVSNTTHTNYRLVIINGEHTGTFVRRVTHKGTGANSIAVCCVVVLNKGSMDTVTDRGLKLPVMDLALIKETNKEKKANRNVLSVE